MPEELEVRQTYSSRSLGRCPYFHQAIELLGRRWTGVIVQVLLPGPLRFSEIGHAIPNLSDRLLSQRIKELEEWGLLERQVVEGHPIKVVYMLTKKGQELGPALDAVRVWARRWIAESPETHQCDYPATTCGCKEAQRSKDTETGIGRQII